MDKVDFSKNIENSLSSGLFNTAKTEVRKTRDRAGPRGTRRKGFSDILEHSIFEKQELGPVHHVSPSEQAIQILLDEVRSSADSLKRRPLPEELLSYKKAVRDFLNYVVENSYQVEQAQGIKRKIYIRGEKRWDAKIHHQIKIVDQKLEEMAAGILLKQIKELDLKHKLEEITGLLVDLTISGNISQG